MKTFAAWTEALANVGVLIGIIFLTIEVSQNTLATKSDASLAIQTAISESISRVQSNPALFDVVYKIYYEEELTPKEYLLAAFYWHSFLTLMDGAVLQYELGVIDLEVLQIYDQELYVTTHQTTFAKRYWENEADSFSPALQAYVANVIKNFREGAR
ncbi:hypothetical protein R0135_10910 [Congregibacter variabilis]|uniref:DUF4760 domain-containing protein n=1 Tax=Congregibacter variabilis TaxID=3081200 RepID=A0ABZ0I183_9GAMM|nr:hypothetical protein R0135_10910 [Congregibacter sp. IMCC43200]